MFGRKKKKLQKESEDYWYFDDHYYNSCQRWEERIDNIDTSLPKTAQNIKAYEKKIETAKKFKEFCESKRGGAEYYQKEYPNLISELEADLEEYKQDIVTHGYE